MTSRTDREAFVWIWLPGETVPTVAGRLSEDNGTVRFNYGRSYLDRTGAGAIPIYEPELPLQAGSLLPRGRPAMPSCIRDAAPDAWGRRVIANKLLGTKGAHADTADLNELTYLLESGSDRIGALDFQRSPIGYEPREEGNASLEELLESAGRIEKGEPLHPERDRALLLGSSIGGARPKALIQQEDTKYIAKFSSSTDLYNVVKAEFVAMRLARLAGLNVAPVQLVRAARKDVLLVERFDRRRLTEGGWSRMAMVSALTLLGLDEMEARYASYQDLAEIVRRRFAKPQDTLRELFSRLAFNILCGNTDDHARNHAAFWDGETPSLTPAYDLCPQSRTGGEASQAMLIAGDNNLSQLKTCLATAECFLLSEADALAVFQHLLATIRQHWDEVCAEAQLSAVDKNLLWGRQFLNPFALEGLQRYGVT